MTSSYIILLFSMYKLTLLSYLKYKEEEILLHPQKKSQAGHNTCKHYRLFLCISLSVNYAAIRHFQALPRHVIVP